MPEIDIEPTVCIIREVINKSAKFERGRHILHEAYVSTNSPVIKGLRDNFEIAGQEQWGRIRPALKELIEPLENQNTRALQFLKSWRDMDLCDCEDGHTCGKAELINLIKEMEE